MESWLGSAGADSDSIRSSIPSERWRRRCLYFLILLLLIAIIINFALTLWIIKVFNFSADGMGSLRVLDEGIRLDGSAYMMSGLVASTIRSPKFKTLHLQGGSNVTITSWDPAATSVLSGLVLNGRSLSAVTKIFSVRDQNNKNIFYADKDNVTVNTEVFHVSGEGGAVFNGSIQTPVISSQPSKNLRLESPTRTVEVVAPAAVTVESRAGEISAISLANLQLTAKEGQIILDTEDIRLPTLKDAPVALGVAKGEEFDVYQLCVCSSGKLYLSKSTEFCGASFAFCQ